MGRFLSCLGRGSGWLDQEKALAEVGLSALLEVGVTCLLKGAMGTWVGWHRGCSWTKLMRTVGATGLLGLYLL